MHILFYIPARYSLDLLYPRFRFSLFLLNGVILSCKKLARTQEACYCFICSGDITPPLGICNVPLGQLCQSLGLVARCFFRHSLTYQYFHIFIQNSYYLNWKLSTYFSA